MANVTDAGTEIDDIRPAGNTGFSEVRGGSLGAPCSPGAAPPAPLDRRSLRAVTARVRIHRPAWLALTALALLLLLGSQQRTASASCDRQGTDVIVIRSGDTLRSLARAYYGTEACADLIAVQNSLQVPDLLQVGDSLVLAPASVTSSPDARVRYSYGISGGPRPSTPAPSLASSSLTSSDPFAVDVTTGGGGSGLIWPLTGPITQPFGVPELGVGSPHTGIDIGQPTGTPIRASQAGRITYAGGDPCCGLGYWVEINHGNRYATRYGHLMRPAILLVGDYVRQGQVVGFSGTTGFSTGPHLHFEVRLDGNPIDPLWLLPFSTGRLPVAGSSDFGRDAP